MGELTTALLYMTCTTRQLRTSAATSSCVRESTVSRRPHPGTSSEKLTMSGFTSLYLNSTGASGATGESASVATRSART